MPEISKKVLIVDADRESLLFFKVTLLKYGYTVYAAESAYDVISMYSGLSPDIVIFDPNISDMYLKDFVHIIRKERDVPIIVISESANEADKLSAFENGADDYIVKPLATKELLARMKNAIRHTKKADNVRIFHTGNLSVNFTERRVSVEEKTVSLTATEYTILALLAKSAGRVLQYSDLIKKVWGKNSAADVKRLHVNIANIRKKLGEIPKKPEYILTENGVGYKIVKS